MEYKSSSLDLDFERKLLVPTFDLTEFKADDGKKGRISGYGIVFSNVDLGKDIVDSKSCDETISDHTKNGTMPFMFYQHDKNEPIGDWVEMKKDDKGIYVVGDLWLDKGIVKAEQAYMMCKGRGQKGLSMGYKTEKADYDKKGNRVLQKIKVKEISPVAFPMNEKATIMSVKSFLEKEQISVREAEDFLREVGMSQSQAKSFLAKLSLGIKVQRDAEQKADDESKDIMNALSNTLKSIKL